LFTRNLDISESLAHFMLVTIYLTELVNSIVRDGFQIRFLDRIEQGLLTNMSTINVTITIVEGYIGKVSVGKDI
jgi:hypothetical protein